jgi:hypothetical protein
VLKVVTLTAVHLHLKARLGSGAIWLAQAILLLFCCRTGVLAGDPDPKYISTSYVERQNLSMRMGMRRFTRLTNGFSKKFENHAHQVALYFFHYNFCRVHKTLRVTPAMEAGLTDHVWTLDELVGLLPEKKPNAKIDRELVLKALAKSN